MFGLNKKMIRLWFTKEIAVERVVQHKTNNKYLKLMNLLWSKWMSYFLIVLVAICLIKRFLKNNRKD